MSRKRRLTDEQAKFRLAIVPNLRDGQPIWQLIHVGWFRNRVIAQSRNAESICNAARHIVDSSLTWSWPRTKSEPK